MPRRFRRPGHVSNRPSSGPVRVKRKGKEPAAAIRLDGEEARLRRLEPCATTSSFETRARRLARLCAHRDCCLLVPVRIKEIHMTAKPRPGGRSARNKAAVFEAAAALLAE